MSLDWYSGNTDLVSKSLQNSQVICFHFDLSLYKSTFRVRHAAQKLADEDLGAMEDLDAMYDDDDDDMDAMYDDDEDDASTPAAAAAAATTTAADDDDDDDDVPMSDDRTYRDEVFWPNAHLI